MGASLCLVGCLAVFLASVVDDSTTHPPDPSFNNQKCPQTLPIVTLSPDKNHYPVLVHIFSQFSQQPYMLSSSITLILQINKQNLEKL